MPQSDTTPSQTAAPPGPDELRTWLAVRVAEYTSYEGEIRPDVPFSDYGLTSIHALALCGDVEDRFGIEVDSTLMWDHDTVGALTSALVGSLDRR
ncbi:acyl carrier protein [Streptomyces sp. NPDC048057]|uniref:acyl carrier protein n=1 Tax=Streptomyces sp. NPDC048057 TaxID=3155628 RepID=UPI0033CC0BA3